MPLSAIEALARPAPLEEVGFEPSVPRDTSVHRNRWQDPVWLIVPVSLWK
jgi:hypothetical protein